ncbi:MAG: DUF58 domain-containing protein [Acidimicrobiales bacterium]
MRPGRLSRTAVTLIAVSLALWGIARTTGSGWIIVVVSVAAGLLIAGVVMPALAMIRADIELQSPHDATAGSPSELIVTVTGPAMRIRVVDPPGPWTSVVGGAVGGLAFVPECRGVLTEVRLAAECGAPLGVFWWKRRWKRPLTPAIEVGPAPLPYDVPEADGAAPEDGDALARSAGDGDTVRGAREYRAGDSVRLMHWPATARRGEPMIKELERDPERVLVVTPDLSGPVDQAERAAGKTAGLIGAALIAGRRVVLVTREHSGTVAGPVTTATEAGRRLARAHGSGPQPVPDGFATGEVIVVGAW